MSHKIDLSSLVGKTVRRVIEGPGSTKTRFADGTVKAGNQIILIFDDGSEFGCCAAAESKNVMWAITPPGSASSEPLQQSILTK